MIAQCRSAPNLKSQSRTGNESSYTKGPRALTIAESLKNYRNKVDSTLSYEKLRLCYRHRCRCRSSVEIGSISIFYVGL